MDNDHIQKTAKHILSDRKGADYYRDVNLLSNYLQSSLGISMEKAEKTAKQIDEDRRGANYYNDEKTLEDMLIHNDL